MCAVASGSSDGRGPSLAGDVTTRGSTCGRSGAPRALVLPSRIGDRPCADGRSCWLRTRSMTIRGTSSLSRVLGGSGMECPRCRADNRDGARFCRECGATFTAACPSCGAKVEAGSKFCDSCGAALAAAPTPSAAASRFASPELYTPKHLAERILTSKSALEGERKHVTV